MMRADEASKGLNHSWLKWVVWSQNLKPQTLELPFSVKVQEGRLSCLLEFITLPPYTHILSPYTHSRSAISSWPNFFPICSVPVLVVMLKHSILLTQGDESQCFQPSRNRLTNNTTKMFFLPSAPERAGARDTGSLANIRVEIWVRMRLFNK